VGWSYSPEIRNSDNLLNSYSVINRDRDEQQRISIGLGNVFQLKMNPGKNGQQGGNVTLLNVNASTGYNFMAKNNAGIVTGRWDGIALSARTEQYGISLSYSSSYDFYDDNETMLNIPRLINSRFDASTGLRLSGKFIGGEIDLKQDNTLPAAAPQLEKSSLKPWSLNAQLNASHSNNWDRTFKVFTKNTSFSLSEQAALQFTENWSLSYSNRFDFESNKIVDQSMNLRRDFHCWDAVFDWVISGYQKGYYFRIGVKDIPDIKFEKRYDSRGY
ncbi:MAG: hypothetical protein JNL74_16935, partial [Fibrobacteres bacterium]|nr:hypothetical protein [Fibrobacterota bacterium]